MGIVKTRILQNNFTGGIISPLAYSRTDLNKFKNSVREMENFVPYPQGAAFFRRGFQHCCSTKDSGTACLIPFTFNTQQNYILEFGNLYIRVLKDGELVTDTAIEITAISKANPAVVTYNGSDSGLSNGDRIIISDCDGMIELNRREFEIANIDKNNDTFELKGVNSTDYSTYYGDGTFGKIIEIVTPYIVDDVFDIYAKTQSGDVLYLFHYSYAPRKLSRLSDTSWQFAEINFKHPPTYEQKANVATYKDVISITISGTTATLTSTAHGFVEGNFIAISGCDQAAYNDIFKIVSVPTADTLTFTTDYAIGMDATGDEILVSGGVLKPNGTTGDGIIFIAGERLFQNGDVGRTIQYGTARATITDVLPVCDQNKVKTVESLTRGKNTKTATVTITGHPYIVGDWVVIDGAKQTKYNGTFKVKTTPTADTFTYTLPSKDVKRTATGDISCYITTKAATISSLARTDAEVKVITAAAHGLSDGDQVLITESAVDAYNKKWFIYDVDTTEFYFTVTGTPADDNPAPTDCRVYLKSPTNTVKADIKDDFPNKTRIAPTDWYLSGSPVSTLTFNDTKADRLGHGALISIDAKYDTFRSIDVGKFIKFQRADTGTYASYLITKFVDATRVKAEILKRMHANDYPEPESGETEDEANERNPKVLGGKWTLESAHWNASDGYPEASTFFLDRLWVTRGDMIWASVVGDYEKFLTGADDDNAIEYILGSRQINQIKWILPKKSLFIGTTGGEWRIDTIDGTLTPSTPNAEMDSSVGSYNQNAVLTPYSIIYPQLSGYKLREIAYDFASDSYTASDISLLFEHLMDSPIRQIAFLGEPLQTIVLLLENGALIAIAYQREHEIVGAYVITSGDDTFESIATIHGSYGDDLYAVVKRSNGRYIERLVAQ